MQPICTLANTGTNPALIIALSFGVIATTSLILYYLKTGKRFSTGFLSLMLLFGLLSSVLLTPIATHAGGAPDCPQGSLTSSTNQNTSTNPNTPAPLTCPENWIVVPGNPVYDTEDFCVMKYDAKNVGGSLVRKLIIYSEEESSISGTWSINIASPITATVGPFPYDVDAETVAAALEAAVGETVTTNTPGRVEQQYHEANFFWASLDDTWDISLNTVGMGPNGLGAYAPWVDSGVYYKGGAASSQASSQPWANITQLDATTAAQASAPGAHLVTENEWMTIAHNVLMQPENWCDPDGSNCGAAPGTVGKILANGHDDSDPYQSLEASNDDSQACFGTVTLGVNTPCGSEDGTQKRTLTLSNGEVIWDFAGNIFQWTSGTETRGNLPSNNGNSGCFEYNVDTLEYCPEIPDNWGTLAYINPAIQNPAAANWGVAQGIGGLQTDFLLDDSSSVVGFIRGGFWQTGPVPSGAFTLYLGVEPSSVNMAFGFRAAR